MSNAITVTSLAVTPVKALRLQAVDAIELVGEGARENRRFCVIDEKGRMLNGKMLGGLQTVVGWFDPVAGELGLRFPDGSSLLAPVAHGEPLEIRFFSHACGARLLQGPWAAALSDHLGRVVRLVEPERGVDRGREGGVSVISQASLARLAQEAGESSVDARRFRMLIEIDGVAAHAEDGWVGRRVRVGAAEVAFHGHVGRCLTTSRDPDSGEVTLPTLDVLGAYRQDLDSTEPLPFGIYGAVVTPGTVRLGDALVPVDG
ncbi:MAG: MOSC domain-containing protein [Actinomycetota bacterium]|nr:MOSC domain-containing protein [Actinomycetota bacterium]